VLESLPRHPRGDDDDEDQEGPGKGKSDERENGRLLRSVAGGIPAVVR
jgi:hypothetical protein